MMTLSQQKKVAAYKGDLANRGMWDIRFMVEGRIINWQRFNETLDGALKDARKTVEREYGKADDNYIEVRPHGFSELYIA